MMILYDEHGKFLEIEMIGKNGIAWENEFFDLKLNENDILVGESAFERIKEPYRSRWINAGVINFVHDVEYCLDQALDCQDQDCTVDFDGINSNTKVTAKIYEFNEVII